MGKRPSEGDAGVAPKRARPGSWAPPQPTAIAPNAMVPDQLDVEAAINVRKTEILALHRAMKQAREATNTRAWQLLPRHLRRRAASHNLLRLPSRLRSKARAELRASNTTPKTRSAMRRRAPERTLIGFARRRAALTRRAARHEKRWLETHLWHAKRFRAAHGWEEHWTNGAQMCSTILLQRPVGENARVSNALFVSPLAPIQVLWVAGHGAYRECHVWVHPAGAPDVHALLLQALKLVRIEAQRSSKHRTCVPQRWDVPVDVHVARLESAPHPALAAGTLHTRRGRAHHLGTVEERALEGYNVFELSGSDAGRILGGVLQPVEPANQLDGAAQRLFSRITGRKQALTPSQLPHGLVISLLVHDPRLAFPPKNAPLAQEQCEAGTQDILDVTTPLNDARFFSYKHLPVFSKGDMDRRRAQLVPGEHLRPTAEDDRIPVVLIASWQDSPLASGYTLLVPRGWALPFWHSLVFTGARVLGQEQLRQRHLNAGLATFPHDWVASRAYAVLEREAAVRRAEAWRRKPPAKRVNYDHGEAVCPHPFGGMELWRDALQNGAHAPCSDSLVDVPITAGAWARLQEGVQRPAVDPKYTRYVSLWTRRAFSDGVNVNAVPPSLPVLRNSLVRVLLIACRRGAFQSVSTLHLPPTMADTRAWRAALDPPTREKQAARSALDALERSVPEPFVGAVTTGDYALADGRGRAVASMSLLAWMELERRETALAAEATPHRWGLRKRNPVPLAHLVLVRNVQGGVLRAASAKLMPT
ncbi:ribonuclease P [Malassezia brasiliensis]|uniref:Ribonuclease P n=1 Tax=Malassezia brasiliensis TaxID=1821822 RepID=A0AAF0DS43_9BASI|nr:ribonuclease P [Malassezia brasiliensis]